MTNWGIKLTTGAMPDQISILGKLTPYFRIGEGLKNHDGKIGWIDKGYPMGVKFLLNILWEEFSEGMTPRLFPRDMTLYRTQLRKLLSQYHDKIEVAVCENEMTTDKFYQNGQTDYYIRELKAFCNICNDFGVKCADGGTHIENIYPIMVGSGHRGHNVDDVEKLINAYKDISNLTYVNFHFRIKDAFYPLNRIVETANYVKELTGKQVISNEFHVEGDSITLLNDVMNKIREADYQYAIKWSGGEDTIINSGMELTPYGEAYKQLISTVTKP